MSLLNGYNGGEKARQERRFATPGTPAAFGGINFGQLRGAFNSRTPVLKGGMLGAGGDGSNEYTTPEWAVSNGYVIQPTAGSVYNQDGGLNQNPDLFSVYKDLGPNAKAEDYNNTPFDVYTNDGRYVGTHSWQNMDGEGGIEKFWNAAIPIVTTLFIGGGAAGAFGGGAAGAAEGAGAAGVGEGAAAGMGAAEGAGALTTGGGGFGSAGQVFGGNIAAGSGYGTAGLGSSLGGASGLGGAVGSGLGAYGSYAYPGLGSSLVNAGATAAGSSAGAGLPPGGGGGGGSTPSASTPTNFGDLLKNPNTLNQLANLGGTLYSASQAGKAADAQAAAAREAMAMFEPWRQAGGWSIGQAATMLGKNGAQAAKNAFMQSPDYEFRRSEGEKALTRAAAASGLRGSGKFLKDYNRFNQDLASSEFGNSINRLLGVAGMGQTATGSTADYATQAANATAAGAVGKANAISGGISQGLSMYQNSQQREENNALMRMILAGRA